MYYIHLFLPLRSAVNASESVESELMKNDLPEGVGGNGGRAVAICILIAPIINIDSNIPFEPNAILERPNLSYALLAYGIIW